MISIKDFGQDIGWGNASIGSWNDLDTTKFTGFSIKTIDGENVYSWKFYFTGTLTSHVGHFWEKIGNNPETETTDIPGNLNEWTYIVDLDNGAYVIDYHIDGKNPDDPYYGTAVYSLVANLSVTKNHYPIKKWTILDVINRLFDTVEVLEYGEKPRFRLKGVIYDSETGIATGYESGSIAEEFDKILSPEYGFTKSTLRESLQAIGGFVHAEPRITSIKFDENGRKYFEVDFDKYGGNEYSNIKKRPYVYAGFGVNINDYCTGLDSSAENLVSQLDYAQGVVIEPFKGGYKALRSETTTVRLAEDNNSFISSVLPIYQVKSLKYVEKVDGTINRYDITPYVFENTAYGRLSSYAGVYPYCKAYAVYYTQGEKDIKGLFFKNPDAESSIFQDYAIKNILKEVGVTVGNNYMELSFELTYIPISSARVKTNKSVVMPGIPRNIVYNQNANLVETRYYGENLKGVIARLGNVSKTYTYYLAFFANIPKVGTLFDDDYYISTVSVEVFPYYIKCTLGLTKNFNRLSQYVGISREKRLYEVSERQAFYRDVNITEYLQLTLNQPEARTVSQIDLNGLMFGDEQVSCAKVVSYDKQRRVIEGSEMVLPVSACALGNTMTFTARYEDNYSAGQKIEKIKNKGYWGAYCPYADYYGRVYWLDIDYSVVTGEQQDEDKLTLPQSNSISAKSILHKFFRLRKDSREIPVINYEISAVSNTPLIVIGSALMNNSPKINTEPKSIYLCLFYEKLSSITRTVDNVKYAKQETLENNDFSKNEELNCWQLTFPAGIDTAGAVAWGFATEKTIKTIIVSDDDGNDIEQSLTIGGELMFGINQKPKAGDKVYFQFLDDIYS